MQLLVKGVAEPLRHAALDLSLQDHRVDDGAAVVHHHVAFDLDHHRLRVHLDDHRVHAAGGRAALGAEIVGGFETRFGARLDRAAHRIGPLGQLAQRDGRGGHALDLHRAVHQFQVFSIDLQLVAGLGRILRRTASAAAWIALPATTAPRLAKVPAPQ